MIAFSNITKQYGPQILFSGASFQVNAGEKVGLVGPNGSGKSTLFRLVAGEEAPDDGTFERPRRLTIGFFRQEVGHLKGRTVLAETISGAGEVAVLGERLVGLEEQMANPKADMDRVIAEYGEVQARFQDLGGYELESRAYAILDGLGFGEREIDADVGNLSGGWKMRVSLAQILLSRPDVLLLDEPTNYLDIESILWLEDFLRDYPGAVVMTCHDREVMNRVVRKIIEIDGGIVRTHSGNFDFYEQQREVERERRSAEYERQQAKIAKESQFVERFRAQVAKAAQVQSRIKRLEKIERVLPPKRIEELHFSCKAESRLGDEVIILKAARKAYTEKVVHDNVDLLVRRRERWAIMGQNGAGKTTLLKMMAGVLEPDSGEARLGASVTLGYFAQHTMEVLEASNTVFEELQQHARVASIGVIRSLAGAFGFRGQEADKKISVLSGGEKARVALAKIFYDSPNLLVLDEPTNHLDLLTKQALMRAMSSYDGTLVFVSHDRAFLRAVADRVLELGPAGPHLYPGSYDEYVRASGHEAPGMRST